MVAGIGNQVQAAKPVEVDGLFYEITGTNTVRIVGSGRNEAALVIPEQVTIKNATYIVTAVGTAFAIPDKKMVKSSKRVGGCCKKWLFRIR